MSFFYNEYLNKCDNIYNNQLKSVHKLIEVQSLKIMLSYNEFILDSQVDSHDDEIFLKSYLLFYLMCSGEPAVTHYLTRSGTHDRLFYYQYFNKNAKNFFYDNYYELFGDFTDDFYSEESIKKTMFLANINLIDSEDPDNLAIFRNEPVSMTGPILNLNIKLSFNI